MKKILTALMLGTMMAAMAVPSFAAEAKTVQPAAIERATSFTALAHYDGTYATATGRADRVMDKITVYMDVCAGQNCLPTITATSTGKTYATAKKAMKNVTEVYSEAYGNRDGETVYDHYTYYVD